MQNLSVPMVLGMNSAHTLGMTGTYDYRLVALSVALAMGASYAALDLAGRTTAARHWARVFWLAGGATAMGLGIWSMHYIGMLAFRLSMPVLYDLPTVGLSLLAAIAASAVALHIVSRRTMGRWQALVGSVPMGGGIAAMHYTGMAAMRTQAQVTYHAGLVVASIGLAIVISLVALTLAFRFRNEKHASRRKIIGALVMGSAIPLMHYTGMAAAGFSLSNRMPDLSHAISISNLGIVAISITSVFALVLCIFTSFMDRLLSTQQAIVEAAREGETNFRTLAEAIPQLIWTARPEGDNDYVNQNWQDYTGLDLDHTRGDGWAATVHPDDLPLCVEKWKRSIQTGETFEVEHRLRRASDQTYRWHLARALPIRDSAGTIIKWFGTSTDIHDQKQNQQILEQQIKERTAEVVAANAQLKQEMREREHVQNDLDRQNVAMVEELRKRSDRAVLLAKMGKLLQSAANIDEAIPIVLGFAPKTFPDFRGALFLFTPSRSVLEVAGTWGDCELPPSASFEAQGCWALRTGQRHFVEAGDRTAICGHALATKNSYLCIPILTQGGMAGVLHLQLMANSTGPLESEMLLASSFAEQVGLSISNLKLQEALRQQSIKDALTGLYNRRHLDQGLDREIRRAARGDQHVGVIMFDLDHFKTFNDTFGHEAGDAVLRELGLFLLRSVRAEDIPCRFGGEEFVVILPGSTLEGALARAERLRSQVKELTVTHQGTSLGMITISAGVAAFPGHGFSVKELITAADGALYRAKKAGRDRVVFAEPLQEIDLAVAAAAGNR